MTGIDFPTAAANSFVTSCNPLKEKIQDYDESWNWLGRRAIEYNWEYRKKICSKCSLETQQKLNCYKANNFRIINGKKIQETHCSKLEKARTNKLRNHIKHVFELDPFSKS
jgi:Tfp pilus tip-associated adhesin PilY1